MRRIMIFSGETSPIALFNWGRATNGMLGNNAIIEKSSPVQTIALGTDWASIATANLHTAGIKTNGTLWTWGDNGYGQLGNNSTTNTSSPVQTVIGGTTWSSVSVGDNNTAAIKTDGTLWTWGSGGNGALGDNTIVRKSSPVQTIAGGTTWSKISVGINGQMAAIKTDATLWCWGNNSYGQLGDNTLTNRSSPVQTVTIGTTWSNVSLGLRCTLATKTDGRLWTWGSNSNGQLGDNTKIHRSSPVQTVAFGTTWSSVSGGAGGHSACIKTDGTLWTWGQNIFGELGNNNTTSRSSPTQTITFATNWSKVAAGAYQTTAIKTDGTLWLWGYNQYGVLGDNTLINRSSPVQTITGGNTWTAVSCYSSTVALTSPIPASTLSLFAWGRNTNGQLGNNSTTNTSSPIQTVIGTDWFSIAEGLNHTAGIKTDGTLWTWGNNTDGQLGDNTTTNKSSPVQTITGGSNWNFIACGYQQTAAIKTDGTLWTWGRNAYGQLGDNTITHRSSPVQTITGGSNWRYVSISQSGCIAALKTDNTLWTWGNGTAGALGNNAITHRSSPVQTVAFGTNWSQVATDNFTIACIKTDGTLWTWGSNSNGKLGSNTTTNRSSPTQTITLGTNWSFVSVGYHTAAIKTDGTLWNWGRNSNGQLGINNIVHRSSPIQTVAFGSTWNSVSCKEFTIATKTDGTLWTWGRNAYGNLGDNTIIHRSSPIQTVAFGSNWRYISAGGQTAIALRNQ